MRASENSLLLSCYTAIILWVGRLHYEFNNICIVPVTITLSQKNIYTLSNNDYSTSKQNEHTQGKREHDGGVW